MEYYRHRWSSFVIEMDESRARSSKRKQKGSEEDEYEDYSDDEE